MDLYTCIFVDVWICGVVHVLMCIVADVYICGVV